MAKCEQLLDKALGNPKGMRYVELTALAECYDFEFRRQRGSHAIYTRKGLMRPMNFQDWNGMAKPYQIRQLLDALRELGLIEPKE
jgi:hypothetical protein